MVDRLPFEIPRPFTGSRAKFIFSRIRSTPIGVDVIKIPEILPKNELTSFSEHCLFG